MLKEKRDNFLRRFRTIRNKVKMLYNRLLYLFNVLVGLTTLFFIIWLGGITLTLLLHYTCVELQIVTGGEQMAAKAFFKIMWKRSFFEALILPPAFVKTIGLIIGPIYYYILGIILSNYLIPIYPGRIKSKTKKWYAFDGFILLVSMAFVFLGLNVRIWGSKGIVYFLPFISLFIIGKNLKTHFSGMSIRSSSHFILFLRKFAGFTDKTLLNALLKGIPRRYPVVLLIDPLKRLETWDPFNIALLRFHLFAPFSIPAVYLTTVENWQSVVRQLINNAGCIVIDLSEESEAVSTELSMVKEENALDKTLILASSHNSTPSKNILKTNRLNGSTVGINVVNYQKSWVKAIPKIIFGFLFVFLVPFILIFAVLHTNVPEFLDRYSGVIFLSVVLFLGNSFVKYFWKSSLTKSSKQRIANILKIFLKQKTLKMSTAKETLDQKDEKKALDNHMYNVRVNLKDNVNDNDSEYGDKDGGNGSTAAGDNGAGLELASRLSHSTYYSSKKKFNILFYGFVFGLYYVTFINSQHIMHNLFTDNGVIARIGFFVPWGVLSYFAAKILFDMGTLINWYINKRHFLEKHRILKTQILNEQTKIRGNQNPELIKIRKVLKMEAFKEYADILDGVTLLPMIAVVVLFFVLLWVDRFVYWLSYSILALIPLYYIFYKLIYVLNFSNLKKTILNTNHDLGEMLSFIDELSHLDLNYMCDSLGVWLSTNLRSRRAIEKAFRDYFMFEYKKKTSFFWKHLISLNKTRQRIKTFFVKNVKKDSLNAETLDDILDRVIVLRYKWDYRLIRFAFNMLLVLLAALFLGDYIFDIEIFSAYGIEVFAAFCGYCLVLNHFDSRIKGRVQEIINTNIPTTSFTFEEFQELLKKIKSHHWNYPVTQNNIRELFAEAVSKKE